MKIATPKSNGFQKKSEPLLPLMEDGKLYKLDKTNSVTWELSTVPGTTGAAMYNFQCRVLQGDKTPRQMICWRLDVMKVVTGLNINTVATVWPIHEACMRTRPLASYASGITVCAQLLYNAALEAALVTDQAAGDTVVSNAVRANRVDHYINVACLEEALGLTVAALLPRKILAKVKRSLRQDMQKPKDIVGRTIVSMTESLGNERVPSQNSLYEEPGGLATSVESSLYLR
jgi:hypothetical protein